MANENENQAQTQLYNGQETNLEELDADFKRSEEEAKKNSRFRQIASGKTAMLVFTGKVFKRVSTGTDDKGIAYKSDKIDFELVDIIPDGNDKGKNKIFSMGAKNKTVKEIIANLKSGQKTMNVSRQGEGKSTKYSVTTPE